MAIVDNLRTAPRLFFVTFALLFLGGVFVFTAIISPNWLVGKLGGTSIHAGLWVACDNIRCNPIPAEGTYIAIRVLCVMAIFGAGASGLVALAFVPRVFNRKSLAFLIAIGCLMSSLAIATTVILYAVSAGLAADYPSLLHLELGWSFIIACLGCSCLFVASITGFVVACNVQTTSDQSRLI